MAGDPACWSHLFYDDEGEPKNMTTTVPIDHASAKVAADLTDFLSKNDDRIMQELFEFLRMVSDRAFPDCWSCRFSNTPIPFPASAGISAYRTD